MELVRVTRALKEIQEKTGIDFVSYNYGHCCRTCADFGKRQEDWDNATTFLVGLYYKSGMNYNGSFDKVTKLYLNWDFDMSGLPTVKEVFEKYGFTVDLPLDTSRSIIIC